MDPIYHYTALSVSIWTGRPPPYLAIKLEQSNLLTFSSHYDMKTNKIIQFKKMVNNKTLEINATTITEDGEEMGPFPSSVPLLRSC